MRRPSTGRRSVTVPGAVRLWADLAERFGRLGLDAAVGAGRRRCARRGVACTARIADKWAQARARALARAGDRRDATGCPSSPRRCAGSRRKARTALYEGEVAAAIAAACWLSEDDLAAHRSEWVEPLRRALPWRRGLRAAAERPGRRGAARAGALRRARARPALGDRGDEARVRRTRARSCTTARSRAICSTRSASPRAGRSCGRTRPSTPRSALPRGGTTYLCAVDGNGMAVSLIQSLYEPLRLGRRRAGDRASCSRTAAPGSAPSPGHPNALAPAKRPFHTIIPGMLLEDGAAARAVRRHGRADAAAGPLPGRAPARRRGRRSAGRARRPALAGRGGRLRRARARARALIPTISVRAATTSAWRTAQHGFGVGQMILRLGDALIGGSDGRGDGYAAGLLTAPVAAIQSPQPCRFASSSSTTTPWCAPGCGSCSTARRTSRSSARRATATPASAPRASRSRTSSSSTSSCRAARGWRCAPRS